ncbi:MAG: hypothetical protein GX868_14140 [Actinobacteria bacterium]|nr:hypothetical protein [Actinomycetota bacterium]
MWLRRPVTEPFAQPRLGLALQGGKRLRLGFRLRFPFWLGFRLWLGFRFWFWLGFRLGLGLWPRNRLQCDANIVREIDLDVGRDLGIGFDGGPGPAYTQQLVRQRTTKIRELIINGELRWTHRHTDRLTAAIRNRSGEGAKEPNMPRRIRIVPPVVESDAQAS